MERVTLKVKRLDNNLDLPLPAYETDGSSGLDIRASVDEPMILEPGDIRLIPTGLSVSIPPGYEGQIRPRSGLALKHGIGMVNSPGTIDSDYRGEIKVILINLGNEAFDCQRGMRIAQLVVQRVERVRIEITTTLTETHRGDGGFGSTGSIA